MNNRIYRILRSLGRIGLTIICLDYRRAYKAFSYKHYDFWLKYHQLDCSAIKWSEESASLHVSSGGPELDYVIRSLDVPKRSVVLDLGSGKGIAALTLAKHFSQVIGVELNPELVQIANSNVSKVGVKNISILCADVRDLGPEIDLVNYIYLFNPFPTEVMQPALQRVKESLGRNPRPLTVVYKYPVCDVDLRNAGFQFLREMSVVGRYPYSIYVA